MTYKFKTPRPSQKPKFDLADLPVASENDEIGLIQGKVADSKQEWWVAQALERLKLNYIYQYPINGGSTRGGYKVDFVVLTVPLATMVEPIGDHWHTGELGADDRKRQVDVENAMRDIARTPILNLWIPDLLDRETVFLKLRRELS